MTKTSNVIQLSPRQEKEAGIVKRLAAQYGWEIYSIGMLANSTALEYRLQSREVQKNGRRAYHNIKGANTDNLSEQQIEALLTSQLEPVAA